MHVGIRTTENRVCASVVDDGPGILVTERERIFEAFVRLNGTPGNRTGLGLAIARSIAHQHHGEITCDDGETGARFTLQLPTANSDQTTQ